MTNYEKYKDEIEKITRLGYEIAVNKNDNTPYVCDNFSCDDCIASTDTCFEIISKWADAEYIEPGVDWYKVAVNTPVLVKTDIDDIWLCRHFAKYERGHVYTWDGRQTSYTCDENNVTWWEHAKLLAEKVM